MKYLALFWTIEFICSFVNSFVCQATARVWQKTLVGSQIRSEPKSGWHNPSLGKSSTFRDYFYREKSFARVHLKWRACSEAKLPRLPRNCHTQVVTPKSFQTKLTTLLEQPWPIAELPKFILWNEEKQIAPCESIAGEDSFERSLRRTSSQTQK